MNKIFFCLCLSILLSCTSGKEKNDLQNDVPKALQENNNHKVSLFSKRGSDDLVEELYKEKVKSSAELQSLEKLIAYVNEGEQDSLFDYNSYKAKNERFFGSINNHLSSIKDSSLKSLVNLALEKNIAEYKGKTSSLEDMVISLKNSSQSISDRHTVLMILVSIEMIRDFQQNQLSSLDPIKSVVKDQNRLIQKIDSAITKNKYRFMILQTGILFLL